VLRDGAGRSYRSRVEDLGPGTLTVARPLELPAAHGPNAEVLVTWSCSRGIAVLPTRLVGAYDEGQVALLSLAITAEAWVEQRRRFVRVPASGPLTLRMRDEPTAETVTAHLLDISEAALRCAVNPAAAELLVDDVGLTATFRFGECEFTIPARVGFCRPTDRPAERAELVVLFDEPVKEADALRKEVYAQQLRISRIGSGS